MEIVEESAGPGDGPFGSRSGAGSWQPGPPGRDKQSFSRACTDLDHQFTAPAMAPARGAASVRSGPSIL
jgi:hypothetical protein